MIFLKKLSGEFMKGSLILFIMINLYNFLNYFFHFLMARLLGPEDFGTLAVLVSVIYIFMIPSEAIQTIITKYTSRLSAKKNLGAIKDLFYRSVKKGLLVSFLIFAIFIPVSLFLSDFLKIDLSLLALTGLFIFVAFLMPLVRGILQGRKKFVGLGLNMILEASVKIILAVSLVIYGWRVWGSIIGILMGGTAAFLSVFLFTTDILSKKRKSMEFKGIYSYSLPVFVAIVSLVLIYSLDIILAKRFFNPEIAGKYAVISMLGKMIFFGTYSIGKAMFPLASEKHESGKPTSEILGKSLKIVSLLSLIALLVYLFFPKLIIRIFFGSAYVDVFNILFIIGLAFTFLSIANIIILYNFSVNKTKKTFSLLFFVILEIILLSIFNSNLFEFSISVLIVSFLIFLYSLFLLRV